MEISFGIAVILLVLLYWFRRPIKQKSEDIEHAMKISSAEDGIDYAKRVIAIKTEADKLGDIPNIDEVLKQLNGKSKPTNTVQSQTQS